MIRQHIFDIAEPTGDPHRWTLTARDSACAWGASREHGGFLMGGISVGNAVDVLERVTERPIIWASAQFLSYARVGAVIDLLVELPGQGRTVTQARVTGSEGDRTVFTLTAALGGREGQPAWTFATMPDAPHPDQCAVRIHDDAPSDVESLHTYFDERNVPSPNAPNDGVSLRWTRCTRVKSMSASLVAIMADFLPGASRIATGGDFPTNSLDNTIRFHDIVPTEWVLTQTHITAVRSGLFHGSMMLFAEDGTLLATANQSGIARTEPLGS